MADVLTVVARIRAAKGKGDALAAFLLEQVAAVRSAEPGCLDLPRSPLDPDSELFLFYETVSSTRRRSTCTGSRRTWPPSASAASGKGCWKGPQRWRHSGCSPIDFRVGLVSYFATASEQPARPP